MLIKTLNVSTEILQTFWGITPYAYNEDNLML